MIASRRHLSSSHSSRSAFTLIELLIVLAIIGLLAAILFPAFRRAQESGAQASCASNLKQIYQAVELYRQDEKIYPASLAVLLPNDFNIANPAGATSNVPMAPPAATAGPACDTGAMTCPNPEGTGHFKGGRDALVCNDDDYEVGMPRSSYGDISTNIAGDPTDDMGRYVWNYWGYRAADVSADCSATKVTGCAGTAFQSDDPAYVTQFETDSKYLVNPAQPFSASNPVAPTKLPRLANRFAPTSTIITHCVYHRLPTASGDLSAPFELTDTTGKGAQARDIVLRRDGSAKALDVSKFHDAANAGWAKQNF